MQGNRNTDDRTDFCRGQRRQLDKPVEALQFKVILHFSIVEWVFYIILCCYSLAQFFNKIKRWSDMSNMSEDFRKKIESLEGNFAVSCNVFKEYAKTFSQIFKNPTNLEENRHHRSRKQK